ncbi:RdgB/HAM1 family non-canonical purine NTP pyrophosphatase [Paratissierella segnis]|jgi:XTP/dITP diphosphohydrolase|uniref:dITP/XTP pyrophosphatase n=1 Tax=Paratissierella segnis TaxID=2763679 RepID=A0A926IIV9_9FIRM|nr:RdgB/HAM1 family non-canonical purine NTP pyrophosphatase [Paratissierella segnis]MBC8586771.1 RdgB/HAM1 family non-canonical purine NTP pyrophosphatase [Paratissierella segnis]
MNKRVLVLSTENINKINEIKHILRGLEIKVLSKKDVNLEDFEVIEDGNTLEENSLKKASALAEKIDYMVIADDTGLFVDALNGEPGVYSARYAGEDGNDKKNNEKLLGNLKGKSLEQREAKFLDVITLITEDKKIYTVKGECKGTIALELRGPSSFGYDPLFIPEGYDKTFAELGSDIKDKISHRAKALKNLKNTLIKILEDDIDEDSRS